MAQKYRPTPLATITELFNISPITVVATKNAVKNILGNLFFNFLVSPFFPEFFTPFVSTNGNQPQKHTQSNIYRT